MKQILLTIVLLSVLFGILSALSSEPSENDRLLQGGILQDAGSLQLKLTNYGSMGDRSGSGLIFPLNSGINYLYNGAIWIGAKKYRRDTDGELLYWLAQNPSEDSSAVITQHSPLWNPSLQVVIDTLTSCGFDGDRDLYELLPAYNPLLAGNTLVQGLYSTYNNHDRVLKSILSYPSPREFVYPDPLGNYCFTQAQNVTGNEPGFETCSAYYYDFCPFGTSGQRDWGSSSSSNNHVPLNIAVQQKSHAWPLQNHDRIVVFEYIIQNCGVDSLYDIALGAYIDCDIGPTIYGAAIATDDMSGYIMGQGYEFAYSRDNDGDNGMTPGLLACKLVIPNMSLNRSAYYWKVGDGPNDYTPTSLALGSRNTANEKYWLMTGRNPIPGSATKFQRLRGGPLGDVIEYEQPSPNDTRFLNCIYADLPTAGNPHPANRLSLAPMQSMSLYLILFADYTLNGLKTQSQNIEAFINSGFDLGNTQGLTSLPYVTSFEQASSGTVEMNWFSYTNPDHFLVMYKLYDAPASDWQSIELAGTARTAQISGLTDLQWYKFKLASVFNPGPNEVYLESQTIEFLIDDYNPAEDELATPILPVIYPNPFNSLTGTTIKLYGNDTFFSGLSIYNLKGQLVKTYSTADIRQNNRQVLWKGEDNAGKKVSSGVYLIKLQTRNKIIMRKMLLLR